MGNTAGGDRRRQLMAAVSVLGVSLGMTSHADGAQVSDKHIPTAGQASHKADSSQSSLKVQNSLKAPGQTSLKIDDQNSLKYQSSLKGPGQTSLKLDSQNSLKYQDSLKTQSTLKGQTSLKLDSANQNTHK